MSISSRQEARLLSADEVDLVARSHHPRLREADDTGLADLIGRLRERRDRARDVSRRQRRELRGKAAPSGVRPATDNTGTREKAALLAAAVKRASKESERRRNAQARGSLVATSRRALALKQAAGDRTAGRPAVHPHRRSGDEPDPEPKPRSVRCPGQPGARSRLRRGGGPR
jgi:hypothetical protein